MARALHWQNAKAWGVGLAVLYVGLALAALVLGYLLSDPSDDPLLVEAGRGTALVGFSLLTLQFALSARLRWVDRPFGLDVVMRWHRGMGIFATALMLSHPFELAVNADPGWAIWSFDSPWPIWVGKAALLLLLLAVITALLARRLPVDYQTWRIGHKVVFAIIVLGFIHGYVEGDGNEINWVTTRAWWWALLATATTIFAWRNVVVPLWGRRRMRVASVTPETHNVFTVKLAPEDGEVPLVQQPGQFMFLKLVRPGRGSEEHPFTISSAPNAAGVVTATIKKSGDFTNTIDRTRPGDRALVEAPYGRFSYVFHDARRFLFIAGGVGITPIMSMLRDLRDTGDKRGALLLYANRTEDDVLFRDELAAMPPHVEVTHVLSNPSEGWSGPRGRINAQVLREHAGAFLDEADVYLCGPPPMMRALVDVLIDLGVDHRRIHYEYFSF